MYAVDTHLIGITILTLVTDRHSRLTSRMRVSALLNPYPIIMPSSLSSIVQFFCFSISISILGVSPNLREMLPSFSPYFIADEAFVFLAKNLYTIPNHHSLIRWQSANLAPRNPQVIVCGNLWSLKLQLYSKQSCCHFIVSFRVNHPSWRLNPGRFNYLICFRINPELKSCHCIVCSIDGRCHWEIELIPARLKDGRKLSWTSEMETYIHQKTTIGMRMISAYSRVDAISRNTFVLWTWRNLRLKTHDAIHVHDRQHISEASRPGSR